MEWIITTALGFAGTIIMTLSWLHERGKGDVDLRIELGAPEGKSYILRNHGTRTLYRVKLDAEHLAEYRIEEPIFGFRLVPEQPQTFRISVNERNELPDGVQVLYRTRVNGRQSVRYVRLPRPKRIYDYDLQEWVDNPES